MTPARGGGALSLQRREAMSAVAAIAAAGLLPRRASSATPQALYDLPPTGTARILHLTDTHAQLQPVYFREPSANIGVGPCEARPPHLVGRAFLEHFGLASGSRERMRRLSSTSRRRRVDWVRWAGSRTSRRCWTIFAIRRVLDAA